MVIAGGSGVFSLTWEALADVDRSLSSALTRLVDASARASGLAQQTHWRTDAAAHFHIRADAWRQDMTGLTDAVEVARDGVRAASRNLEATLHGYRP